MSTPSVTTCRSYKDTSPGIHFMSPGLLQLFAVRSDQQTHAVCTVSAECCGKVDHGAKRHEHITPILCQLHWLLVRWRVEFKMASLVYQVPSSKVLTYLVDDIHLTSESSAHSLRSSSGRKCSLTRVNSRFGDRSFAAAGPRIWNNLPASLRDKEVSCTEFRRQLKTFTFLTDCGASWLFWLLHFSYTLTYLLPYLLSQLLNVNKKAILEHVLYEKPSDDAHRGR